MTAAVTGLVVLVVVVIKVKEVVMRSICLTRKVKDQTRMEVVPTGHGSNNQDTTTVTSSIDDNVEARNCASISEATEDVYCEIEEF